ISQTYSMIETLMDFNSLCFVWKLIGLFVYNLTNFAIAAVAMAILIITLASLVPSLHGIAPGTFKTDPQDAALTFSRNVVKLFYFKDFNNVEDVLKKVATITQDNGDQTNTHTALEKALSDLFAPGNGVRENLS
ncbi:hypothetical protein DPMN_023645, partial [Dreissena polymorpha]